MSRAERERWETAAERWPHLQAFLSEHMAEYIFGETGALAAKIESELAKLVFDQMSDVALDCWTFIQDFKDFHDDRQFIRDGFGVHGWVKEDDRGRGQTGLARIKILYGALAQSLRRTDPGWQPQLKMANVRKAS